MPDRSRGRGRDSAAGANSWDAGSYDALPKRSRARKRIDASETPPLPEIEPKRRRKLSHDEREQYRERYEVRHTAPLLPPVAKPQRQRTRWWTKAAVFVLFSVLLGSIGAGRYLTPGASPTPTASATVGALAQDSITILSPTPSPTITPTMTPTMTPSPTATPTPNPDYVGKVICLDPGHGGSDRGFSREEDEAAPAMEEAFYNLAFARALRSRLETLGFTVVMTRDSDSDVNAAGLDANGDGTTYANLIGKSRTEAERAKDIDELQARIDVCNDANSDLLISMHINGFDDANANGYETWYSSARPFKDLSKTFAQLAFHELGKQMAAAGYNARPRRVNDDKNANAQVSADAFDRYVITGPEQKGQIVPSAMPGAIVEVLFISNDQDAAFLASQDGRQAIVTAYENAVVQYFDKLAE
jgi:N-acetylmuramoyl-L-alanine amidase